MKTFYRIIAIYAGATAFCLTPCSAQSDLVEAYSFKATTTQGTTQSLLLTKAETAAGPRIYNKQHRISINGTDYSWSDIRSIRIEKTMVSAIELKETINEIPDAIYNINGQIVGKDATSIHNLPKGIYIRKGKKYIVR